MRTIKIAFLVFSLLIIGIYGTVNLISEEWMGVPPKFLDTQDSTSLELKNINLPEEGVFKVFELCSAHLSSEQQATRLLSRLKKQGLPAYQLKHTLYNRVYYTVKVGPFLTELEARSMLKRALKVNGDFSVEHTYLS